MSLGWRSVAVNGTGSQSCAELGGVLGEGVPLVPLGSPTFWVLPWSAPLALPAVFWFWYQQKKRVRERH